MEAVDKPFSWRVWKKKIIFKLQVYTAYIVFRLLFMTLKVKVIDADNIEKAKAMSVSGKYINAIWHQNFLPVNRVFSTVKIFTMASLSKDGDFVTKLINLFGQDVVRGGSSKGGANAVQLCVKRLKCHRERINLVHNMDGPRGPVYEVKRGVVEISRLAQVPIVPSVFLASKYWQLKSWDLFRIPKPFATVYVAFCAPVSVDPHTPDGPHSEQRKLIKSLMLDKERNLRELYNIPDVKN